MEKKKRRPIPTTIFISIVILILAAILFQYEQYVSVLLSLVLVGIIGILHLSMVPCATVFLREHVKQKELSVYKSFAKAYLKNRRLAYSKQNFEIALESNWIDIVTMCLLLGIQKFYTQEEKEEILLNALSGDRQSIFKVLINGGFNCDFVSTKTGDHFLFETLKQANSFYLEFVLKKKVNPNVLDKKQQAPIFIVIKERLTEHLKVLLDYQCDLTQRNKEELTPLFYAVKESNFEACECICEKLTKEDKNHEIQYKKLSESLVINPKKPVSQDKLTLQLVASKDKQALSILEKYFKNKRDYAVSVDTGVEVYARLSHMEATIEKHENMTYEVQDMYTEEECNKDLYHTILKRYKFSKMGEFKLDNIYKQPKCVDSLKEACENCHGTGEIDCSHCEGSGKQECDSCHGTGEVVCSKCGGSLKVSCKVINKYTECKSCQKGHFTCPYCDDGGIAKCPECEGRGTAKCTCPPDKKIQCPKCDKGYIAIADGMYKKCDYCNNGEICGLCQNKGWVHEKFKEKGYTCKVCNGQEGIACPTCGGKKTVKCKRSYEENCTCGTGKQVCPTCAGTTIAPCKHCSGSKKESCQECSEGYIYTNVSIDFKVKQVLQQEKVMGQNEEELLLSDLMNKVADKVCNQDKMIEEVYTLFKVDLKPEDLLIHNMHMQKELVDMIQDKSDEGMMDLLELVPLYYTKMTFKEREGGSYECILVGENFYKTIVKEN